jgi:hypothetical protein
MTKVEWLAAGKVSYYCKSMIVKYAGVVFAYLSTNEKQGRAALTNKKLDNSCSINFSGSYFHSFPGAAHQRVSCHCPNHRQTTGNYIQE